jgi:hypothetical protein
VAVIVTFVTLDTALTVTMNVPLVAPAATVAVAGTVAATLFDDCVNVMPAAGAALLRVTEPVTVVGPHCSD